MGPVTCTGEEPLPVTFFSEHLPLKSPQILALVQPKMFLGLFYIAYIFLTLNLGNVSGGVVQIDDSNWKQILEGEWMVEFYAPWCPACKSMTKTWNEFGEWSKDLDIGVGKTDITLSPILTGRCLITALPTIFHVKNGVFRQFRGNRQIEDFLAFVEEKHWEKIEPLSKLQDPGSIQMGLLGYFFKLSYVMKDYHKILTEDYKFSTWVSYAFFTAATILVGGLLGLLAVLCLDCFRFTQPDDFNNKYLDTDEPTKPEPSTEELNPEEKEEKSPEEKKTD